MGTAKDFGGGVVAKNSGPQKLFCGLNMEKPPKSSNVSPGTEVGAMAS